MSPLESTRGRAAVVALVAACCAALAIVVVWQASRTGDDTRTVDPNAVLAPQAIDAGTLSVADDVHGVAIEVSVERASIATADSDAAQALAEVPRRDFAGVVLDADRGFPLEGATVELEPRHVAHAEVSDVERQTVTTGAEGRFAGTWPGTQDPNLLVRAEGYSEVRLARVDLAEELVVRLRRGASLSVFVEDHGAATGDVEVVVHEMRIGGDRLSEAATATIAPADVADFADLTPGEFFVAAGAPGTGFALERVELAAGEQRRLHLVLPRGTGLAGRVLDRESEEPIAGAEVWVRPSAQGVWSRLERRFEERTTTDEDGRYAFEGLHPGEVVVKARASWGSESSRRLTLDPSLNVTPQDLRLDAPGSISGTVRGERGQAVSGAPVIVSVGRVRGTITASNVDDDTPRSRGAVAVSDDSGRYRIDGLPPEETLYVVADPSPELDASQAQSTARSDVLALELRSGEAREDVDLRLMPTVSVEGRVVDTDGRPVEDVRMAVQRLGMRMRGTWGATRTDEDGHFEVDGLVAGRYRVRATHDDYLTEREEFEVVGDEAPLQELVLTRAAGVEVVVLDERGAAISSANVELLNKSESGRLRMVPPGETDDYGATVFRQLTPGRYTVGVTARDFEPLKAWDTEFDLAAEERHSVEVVLRDRPRAEGAAVVGTVEMTTGEIARRVRFADRRGGSLTVEDGRFRLSGARPGRTRLVLQADDSMPHVTESVLLVPGGELDLGAIELEPAGRVEVRVVDTEGNRLRDAQVRLLPLSAAEGGRGADAKAIAPARRRGQEGYFPRVPLCAWTVRVRHPDFHPRTQRLVVDESRERLTITMQRR